ncbi:SAM-dependent methyltransferase [Candidatus Uabimicrobium amorphum]|uniref:Type 11 methyltransferase n=1 Tax=Uabimicrobium amorphum TaxID=2596890 RepID=A0A5S9INV4_UABAM|nr:methyltransferase domain-containing protein [Candidatus Uabimicrobium amorphum]BBM84480.1 type 11 methyltransferase [Candidatus Uabimicrobium amorphum]
MFPRAIELNSQTIKVKKYYENTDTSYQSWGNNNAYAMHYGYYDSKVQNHIDSLVEINQQISRTAKLKKGSKILDAGCGVGASSFWLARQFSCKVTGISIADHQVRKAKSTAKREGLQKLTEFQVQDFNQLSFPDNSFDVVWAQESYCHSENMTLTIKEANRVLKVGGLLIVADCFLVNNFIPSWQKMYLNFWMNGWAIPKLETAGSFYKTLTKNNFRVERKRDITSNIIPSSQEIYSRAIENQKEKRNHIQVQHTNSCIYQKKCLDLNLWKYLIFISKKLP